MKMDYGVQDGFIPRDFIEYDFAEDALDFEVSSLLLRIRPLLIVNSLRIPFLFVTFVAL